MPTTPETWLTNWVANTTPIATAWGEPQVMQLANGNIWVVWTSATDTGAGSSAGTDIIGQMYSPLGVAIGSETRLNHTYVADSEYDFDIAALPNGGFLLTYVDHNTSTGTFHIRLNELNDDGSNRSTHTLASDIPTTTLWDPQVVAASATSALIIYERDNISTSSPTYDQLKFRLYNPETNTLGAETTLFQNSSGAGQNLRNLDVAVLSNGSYVAVAERSNGGDDNIWYRIVAQNGALSALFSLGQGSGQEDQDPAVAALSGGGFVIAWQNTDDLDTDIMFQIFNNAGAAILVGNRNVHGGGDSGGHHDPRVVALNDGGFLVLYEDNAASDIGLKGQRYAGDGTLVGNSFSLSSSDVNHIEARTLADGRVVVTWQDGLQHIQTTIIDTRDAATGAHHSPDSWQVGTTGDDDFTATRDIVHGWDGDDTIADGAGLNAVYGDAGNDRIGISGVNASETRHGGTGIDTLVGSNMAHGTRYDLAAGYVEQGAVQETITGFEHVLGSNANEILIGNFQQNRLEGGGGNDTLDGGTGTDTILGGAGDDLVILGLFDGADSFDGGLGSDTVMFSELSFNMEVVLGATGTYAFAPGDPTYDLHGVENALMGGGNDRVNGDALNNRIEGGAGDDTLRSGDGNDTLIGGDGDDYLWATGGDNLLVGGDGDDIFSMTNETLVGETVQGGAGTDIIAFNLVSGSAGGFLAFDLDRGYQFNNTAAAGYAGTWSGLEDLQGTVTFRNHITGNTSDNHLLGGNLADTILGGEGQDTLQGRQGDDMIWGEAGNDTLFGEDGHDTLFGEAGGDFLTGAAGNDSLLGGTGDDTLHGGSGDDTLLGEDGHDSIYSGEGNNLLTGGWGHDTLVGSSGNDTLYGAADNDRLQAGAGDDYLDGSFGADVLLGGSGNDTLEGGSGDDLLEGGDGADSLVAGDGADLLLGGEGHDTLVSTSGLDTLEGGLGNDHLFASASGALFNGGEGDDIITQLALPMGGQTLQGGSGRDTLNFALIATGHATDYVAFSLDHGMQVNSTTAATYQGNWSGLENLMGLQNYRNHIQGTDQDNTLMGGLLNDSLLGGDGDDSLSGSAGHDLLGGGEGADSATGGTGNDSLFGAAGADHLLGGDGMDLLVGGAGDDLLGGGSGNDSLTGGTGQDGLYGAEGDDTLLGEAGHDLLSGGAQKDLLGGGAGNDTLAGGEDNDRLYGGAGDDVLAGDTGNDLLSGADGADTLSGGEGADSLYGGTGSDSLSGDGGQDQVRGQAGDDTVNGGAGNDSLYGDAGQDLLGGGAGADLLGGGSGDDRLYGAGDADRLYGGTGQDSLYGGAGNDTLHGGGGADLLAGGLGADVFDFNATGESQAGARDTLAGFQSGLDHIDLSTIDANSTLAGNQAFSFIGGAGFTGAGQLRFVTNGTNGFALADVDGDGTQDWVVQINGLTSMTAGDFIL